LVMVCDGATTMCLLCGHPWVKVFHVAIQLNNCRVVTHNFVFDFFPMPYVLFDKDLPDATLCNAQRSDILSSATLWATPEPLPPKV